MTLNSKKVIHTYRIGITLLCITLLTSVHSSAQELKNSNITFELQGTEVPDSIMNVVLYSATVWSNYIATKTPIRVSVSWQELQSNVNAYAKPTNYYAINGIYYPCALAEKILGKNLNGSNADIEVVINKNITWHLNPETIPSEGIYDLATTLIHEFAHGLGLIGNITSDCLLNSEFSTPAIYDMFVCDSVVKPIVYKDANSYSIKSELLTSQKLYWGGKFAKAYCGENLALYAPSSFNSGSTAYHVDEATYPEGSGLELMSPSLRSSEIIHTPDIATIAMLADIGWTDYFISIDALKNSTDVFADMPITYRIKDTLFSAEKQTVLYSFDAGNHFTELLPSIVANTGYNDLTANVPALAFDHTISYAIRVVTTQGDTIMVPQRYPTPLYSVFVGDDTVKPSITHTPITSTTTNKIDIDVHATISDNFEIDSAYALYFVTSNGTTIIDTTYAPFAIASDEAQATLMLSSVNYIYRQGDVVSYNIFAVDKSGNTANFFGDAFHSFAFEEPQDPITYFITDFESDTIANYFTLDKFSIQEENGFSNAALHSSHHYENTGIDGKYNQYIATLKKPIIIASNPATMTFDEVVLVEPGKAGIEFGSFGFWDFVVVEASKDLYSDTWYVLGKKGWDSQLFSDWETRYYSSVKTEGENKNSYAIGDSTLYKSHTLNLLENKYFRAGDTVFVRFRLQADATNFGWGWAIDNLKIQERMSVQIPLCNPNSTTAYPNPCRDVLYCADSDVKTITIIDNSGIIVMKGNQSPMNVSHLPKGLYSIVVEDTSGSKTIKRIVKL